MFICVHLRFPVFDLHMTIRVAIPDLVSPSYFPAIAAVELGFFKQEGLDATV